MTRLDPTAPAVRTKAERDYLFLCRVESAERIQAGEDFEVFVVVDYASEVAATGLY